MGVTEPLTYKRVWHKTLGLDNKRVRPIAEGPAPADAYVIRKHEAL
jgi:hypothetical protein